MVFLLELLKRPITVGLVYLSLSMRLEQVLVFRLELLKRIKVLHLSFSIVNVNKMLAALATISLRIYIIYHMYSRQVLMFTYFFNLKLRTSPPAHGGV
jgi:hypothetical protein